MLKSCKMNEWCERLNCDTLCLKATEYIMVTRFFVTL